MQACLLTIDDRWLLASHPRFLFSCSLLDSNLSFQYKQFFTVFACFFSHTFIMFLCFPLFSSVLRWCSQSHIPTTIPPKLEHHPFNNARAARDAAVPTRRGRNHRLTGRERERESHWRRGGSTSPWQLCVFVSARESDKQWLTVRRKYTYTHTVTFILTLPLTQREAK